MVAELIPMPANPQDVLRVNRIFPFEEGGKKLLMVVENAAFAELDEPSWRAVHLVAGQERIDRKLLVEALTPDFGAAEAQATIQGDHATVAVEARVAKMATARRLFRPALRRLERHVTMAGMIEAVAEAEGVANTAPPSHIYVIQPKQ